MTFAIAFKLLGSLALLIYGMKMMSEALQKMATEKGKKIAFGMCSGNITEDTI